ncbi:MAG: cob(I)yrinic acid a,c-diamide adenosyltransferase [Candidatus Omnitrophota bacterium]|nr:cob(I)yrinic acid a,c-diamide adenosyltransferase [Candidatus Omnitrophota bacterium]
MKISTKTGDNGSTSLLYGGRVGKDSLRLEVCGTLDELCSFLGLCKSLLKNRQGKDLMEKAQTALLVINSEITTETAFLGRLKRRLNEKDVNYLESIIEKLEKKYKPRQRGFLLPGENTVSAALDIARTITRRAERRVVTLKKKKIVKNDSILAYLNRLSDLLYLLTRFYEKKQKTPFRI